MLIPLLAPSESGAPTGLKTIARALGIAALKVSAEESNMLRCRSSMRSQSVSGGLTCMTCCVLMLPRVWCL